MHVCVCARVYIRHYRRALRCVPAPVGAALVWSGLGVAIEKLYCCHRLRRCSRFSFAYFSSVWHFVSIENTLEEALMEVCGLYSSVMIKVIIWGRYSVDCL